MMVLIAIVTLLLPLIGPAVDHHYFERFASHSHVYLDQPDLNHGHTYDSTFSSTDAESESYIATSGDGFSTSTVTFITDGSSNADYLMKFTDGILGLTGDNYRRPSEITLALPERPPRSSSPVKNLELVERLGNA